MTDDYNSDLDTSSKFARLSLQESGTADILTHFLSDVNLFAIYRKWIIRSGPLRVIYTCLNDVFSWKDPEAAILLIFTIVFFFLCPNETLCVLLLFIYVSILYWWILNKRSVIFENAALNLSFNETLMSRWCEFYDRMKYVSPLATSVVGAIVLLAFFVPINFIALISGVFVMLYHCPCSVAIPRMTVMKHIRTI